MHDDNAEVRVLALGGVQPWPRFAGLLVETTSTGQQNVKHDAVVLTLGSAAELQDRATLGWLQQLAADAAVVVVVPEASELEALPLLRIGVQDVLSHPEPAYLARAIRFAVERRRQQQAARLAYATDLATGLPHEEQLLEYLSQLIALRAREPAALVVIALRTEGLVRQAGQLGQEGAQVLRRKLAVRLRAALRASDVVAAMGTDMFGVLLGHVESAGDGLTVVSKLVQTLQQPVSLAGQRFEVAVAAGLAQWPEHGQDPLDLLQRAKAQATSTAALGAQEGYGATVERVVGVAANDEAAGA